MPLPLLRCFYLGLMVLWLASPAVAQDAGEAAAAWGLLGTWSVNCDQPASPSNAHLSFVRTDGRLMHRRDFGGQRDEFAVISARRMPNGSLEIVLDLASVGGKRTIVFARAGEGRKRAVINRGEKGDYTIRDGKFSTGGAPTPVQSRCSALTN
jgi:hypothetical protein